MSATVQEEASKKKRRMAKFAVESLEVRRLEQRPFEDLPQAPKGFEAEYEKHKIEIAPKAATPKQVLKVSPQMFSLLERERDEAKASEDDRAFKRTMRLAKRDRKNPKKNIDMMPEKEVVVEN